MSATFQSFLGETGKYCGNHKPSASDDLCRAPHCTPAYRRTNLKYLVRDRPGRRLGPSCFDDLPQLFISLGIIDENDLHETWSCTDVQQCLQSRCNCKPMELEPLQLAKGADEG